MGKYAQNASYFCVSETKHDFEQLMKVYSLEAQKHNTKVWSKESVADYIKHVTSEDVDERVRHAEYSVVIEDAGLRQRKLFENGLEVVPWEECFDIILTVHRELGHRNEWYETFKEVSKRYVIDEVCIKNLVKACNICSRYSWGRGVPKREFNKICEVFTMSISFAQDPPYKNALVVIDKLTRFVHIRPITGVDMKSIAVELIKIFANFGAPRRLETKEVTYYIDICAYINEILGSETQVVRTPHATEMKDWQYRINIIMKEWLEVTGSTRWSIGCHFIQWQMNNTSMSTNKTPFSYVFGSIGEKKSTKLDKTKKPQKPENKSYIRKEKVSVTKLKGESILLVHKNAIQKRKSEVEVNEETQSVIKSQNI
ncbi:unnamed protein product [Chilo suppressalis]|uniref:Integrase zinc-binding domain-containing protein n=1 Tax=Chilo suppressalis TaxID=168631 RepID=A0ABN8B7P3_CHISP|nr:unnamed protein product [Chilo suppressalis]